ncbi:MAG: polysaccharide deacetylase family protein [Gemmatimonadota bacterium]
MSGDGGEAGSGEVRSGRSRVGGRVVPFLLLPLALVPTLYWLSPLLFRFSASRSPDVLFRVRTAERAIALTIDDGPDPATTPEILDVLERHGARATFFLIGSRAERHPELVRAIVARGQEIANHMWLDVPSRGLDSAVFERRLLRTHGVLSRFADPRWLRPGGGLYSDRIVRRAEAHGYRVALGTVYPFDTIVRWPELVARFVVAWARPGSVVILHDGGARGRRTAEALRRALPELRRRGYRVTTLSALAGDRAGARPEIEATRPRG